MNAPPTAEDLRELAAFRTALGVSSQGMLVGTTCSEEPQPLDTSPTSGVSGAGGPNGTSNTAMSDELLRRILKLQKGVQKRVHLWSVPHDQIAAAYVHEWVRKHRFCAIDCWHDFNLEISARDVAALAHFPGSVEICRQWEELTGRWKVEGECVTGERQRTSDSDTMVDVPVLSREDRGKQLMELRMPRRLRALQDADLTAGVAFPGDGYYANKANKESVKSSSRKTGGPGPCISDKTHSVGSNSTDPNASSSTESAIVGGHHRATFNSSTTAGTLTNGKLSVSTTGSSSMIAGGTVAKAVTAGDSRSGPNLKGVTSPVNDAPNDRYYDLVIQGSWQGGDSDGIGYLMTMKLKILQVSVDDEQRPLNYADLQFLGEAAFTGGGTTR